MNGVIFVANLRIGDIVTRKSYGGDMHFKVTDIVTGDDGKSKCVLRGLIYRIMADSDISDLQVVDKRDALAKLYKEFGRVTSAEAIKKYDIPAPHIKWMRGTYGSILHIDSSAEFLKMCTDYYKDAGLRANGVVVSERDQPQVIKRQLERYKPDILVLTGHDSIKKDASYSSLESYTNSKYFIESVKTARKYQPDKNSLFIFAGACQSYYEAIMESGANFASSPGRILIHALDPGIVSCKIAVTDRTRLVTPSEIVKLVKSGAKGIGGISSRGHFINP